MLADKGHPDKGERVQPSSGFGVHTGPAVSRSQVRPPQLLTVAEGCTGMQLKRSK